jgi:peptidoglycan hydrolase-like protein with peptidoglycan-binding domain
VGTTAVSVATILASSLLSGCSSGAKSQTVFHVRETTTSSSTTSTTTTPTTQPKPVALPKPPPPGLGAGARGPAVMAVEQRLAALHYDPGKVDGVFDHNTVYAVQAFQKVNGMARSGRVTDDVKAKLETATNPTPLLASGGPTRVEVDLTRQVLFLYKSGELRLISTISSGTGKRFCVSHDAKGRPTPRECAYAVTPGGSYRFTWRVSGWWTSRLGKLYNPVYFNGGIAIHGAESVPTSPASHGCVRIPLNVAQYFPKLVARGDPVYVFGGKEGAPVPLGEKAPQETSTSSSTTPSSSTSSSSTTTTSTIIPTTTTTTKP